MDSECLEEQFKNLQLERGVEAIGEGGSGGKSGGLPDVLPSDRASPHASPLPSPPTADRERRKNDCQKNWTRLSGASTWRPGGAAAVVAVVTRVGEVGWVGGVWFVGRAVGILQCRCFLETKCGKVSQSYRLPGLGNEGRDMVPQGLCAREPPKHAIICRGSSSGELPPMCAFTPSFEELNILAS